MNMKSLDQVESAQSFNRPGGILGAHIHLKVAEVIIRELQRLNGISEADAVEIYLSSDMRHAFDQLEGRGADSFEVPQAHKDALAALAESMGKQAARVVQSFAARRIAKSRRPIAGGLPAARRAHGLGAA